VKSRVLRSSLRLPALIAFLTAIAIFAQGTNYQDSYKGTPYRDSPSRSGPQKIPGPVECACFDLDGEGVLYHDTDSKNNGSGGLNPADGTYLNQFRMDEGVDTSYTKFHDQIDNNPYDLVQPPENKLPVGWTEPGESFNITVQVTHTGLYSADPLYTSNRGGAISLDVNGKDASGPVAIVSTFHSKIQLPDASGIIATSCQGLCGFELLMGKTFSLLTFSRKGT